ncbi:MAG: hypothetical protein SF182_24745 [Deltaproteobacteria bacterium]|nr:hypothetical protein [Deltaproteobacteria bacterium]
MRPPIVRLAAAALVLGLTSDRAAAQPQVAHLSPAPIAAAAGHPGPLIIEKEATSELSKGFGTPHWAAGITSADESFGHVAVLLVDHGSFLSPRMVEPLRAAAANPPAAAAAIRADLQGQRERATLEADRRRLGEQIAELDAVVAHGPLTRRIDPPFGSSPAATPAPAATPGAAAAPVGYVTLLGFSAAGATCVAALPSPDQRYELLVVAGGSLEGDERKPNPASAAYEQRLREHPLDVTEAIARVVYGQLFGAATAR